MVSKAWSKLTLTWKLGFGLGGFYVVATLCFLITYGYFQSHLLTTVYLKNGMTLAAGIADATIDAMVDHDATLVQSIIDQYLLAEDVDYIVVVAQSGAIIAHSFSPSIPVRYEQSGVSATVETKVVNETVFFEIYAPILFGEIGGIYLGLAKTEITRQTARTLVAMGGVFFGLFVVFAGSLVMFLKTVTEPLRDLAGLLSAWAAHRFDIERFPKQQVAKLGSTTKEVAEFADVLANLNTQLLDYLDVLRDTTAAKERIDSELKIARQIQDAMVPSTFPPFPHRPELDIYAHLRPAREVGGDFYDFFFIDDRSIVVTIGDVAGKGVPAALFAAITISLIRSVSRTCSDPAALMQQVNRQLCANNESMMFVTVFYAVISLPSLTATLVNAGHLPGMVRRNQEVIELPNPTGMALGVDPDAIFESAVFRFQQDDGLLLVTDGVSEMVHDQQGCVEMLRLDAWLAPLQSRQPRRVVETLLDTYDVHVTIPHDDLTLVFVQLMPMQSPHAHDCIELPAHLTCLDLLRAFLERVVPKRARWSEWVKALFLVSEEWVMNCIHHGSDEPIVCEVGVFHDMARLTFRQTGPCYNPFNQPPPDVRSSLTDRPVGGLGMYLITSMCQHHAHAYEDGQNCVTLIHYSPC